jgi:hypothetical protein
MYEMLLRKDCSATSKPETGSPYLVSCPRLLIQHIHTLHTISGNDEQLIQRRKTKGGKVNETTVKPVYNGISRELKYLSVSHRYNLSTAR